MKYNKKSVTCLTRKSKMPQPMIAKLCDLFALKIAHFNIFLQLHCFDMAGHIQGG